MDDVNDIITIATDGRSRRRRAPNRRARSRTLMALVAVGLVLAACGGDDDPATDTGAELEAPPDDATASPNGEEADAAGTDAPSATHDGSLPGYQVEVLGWMPWPFADWPREAASQGVDADAPPWALRVSVCADADAAPDPGAETIFAFADASGDFGTEFRSQTTSPIVSPVLMTWPDPGACAEGWVQPNVPVGLEATMASWYKDWDETLPRLDFELGDPYEPLDAPIDGDVLAPGQPHTVDANATWTVHGVTRLPAADPAAVVPEGSYLNAGQGYDLPPEGFEWAAVDAEYCFGDQPDVISESLGLAIDGWATAVSLQSDLNIGPDHLYEPAADAPCRRGLWYAPVEPDATISAVTSTFGSGPWWSATSAPG